MVLTEMPRLESPLADTDVDEQPPNVRAAAPEPGLGFSSWADVLDGDWPSALAMADLIGGSGEAETVRCLVAALRGDPERARRAAARAERFGTERSRTMVGVQLARALAWMWEADMAAAFQSLSLLFASGRSGGGEGSAAAIGIFAEVAVRCGQSEAASTAVDRARGAGTMSNAEAEELALAVAVLGDDSALEEAVGSRASRPALVIARLNLAWGLRLRRTGRVRQARAPLEAALDLFDELDAGAWQRVAARELRAAGNGPSRRSASVPLSPQEMAVAHAVSLGMSNREAADSLYLSPRTISNHLYSIFPKLGVTSRIQLARWYSETVGSSGFGPLE